MAKLSANPFDDENFSPFLGKIPNYVDNLPFSDELKPKKKGNKVKNNRNNKIYTFDFETSQAFLDEKTDEVDTMPLLCCVYDGKEYLEYYGEDIVERLVMFLCNSEKKQCFAHNLKFDFSFIEPYLIRNNYSYKKYQSQELIFVELGENCVLCNTSCIFTGLSLKQIGNIIGEDKLDFSPIYPRNYQIQQEDIDYCKQDCKVLYNALDFYCDTINKYCDWFKLEKYMLFSSGGVSYRIWDKTLTPEMRKLLVINTKEKEQCLKAYYGGTVIHKPGTYQNVYKYDITNCYPSVMVENDYPVGNPYHSKTRPKERLWIGLFKFKHLKLKPNGIPFIIKLASADGEFTCGLTSVDFQLLEENFDYEIETEEYLVFEHKRSGEEIFGKFIHNFRVLMDELKAKPEKKYQNYRTILKSPYNGLYGKTVTKFYKRDVDTSLNNKGVVKNILSAPSYVQSLDKYYAPHGVFITSYARRKLLAPIREIGYENLIYTDTDSITTLCPIPDNFIGKFGKFGMEKNDTPVSRIKIIAPKAYAYIDFAYKLKFVAKGIRKTDAFGNPSVNSIDEFNEELKVMQLTFVKGASGMYAINKVKRLKLGYM